MYIKRNDMVVVLSGKDKGKKGKVLDVNRKAGTVIVEGVNIVTKHVKKRTQEEESRIVKVEAPLYVCKVALIASDGKPTRIGFRMEGDKKVRYSKRTKEVL
ncbi:MAG TPA: 50S ribosomal protein L24 [Spirochaetaceae bacterium]|nr:50S ribosomal protein L24 [Spirochaetaceae bacterium]